MTIEDTKTEETASLVVTGIPEFVEGEDYVETLATLAYEMSLEAAGESAPMAQLRHAARGWILMSNISKQRASGSIELDLVLALLAAARVCIPAGTGETPPDEHLAAYAKAEAVIDAVKATGMGAAGLAKVDYQPRDGLIETIHDILMGTGETP